MTQPMPTFADNRDRLTYLLSEYRIPLTVTFLAAGIWVIWAQPQLPEPPDAAVGFMTAWILLAFPAFIVARKTAQWLYSPDWVDVGICDPGETVIYDGKKVPPDVWEDKTVVGSRPLQPDEGMYDYIVTRFNWYDDISELEVRGVERSDMGPAEALENATRVDEYYEHMHSVRRKYARLKATVARTATEIHDSATMSMIEEREKAELVPGVSVTDELEKAAEKAETDIPDGPGPADDAPQHVRRNGLDEYDGELPNGGVEVPVDDD